MSGVISLGVSALAEHVGASAADARLFGVMSFGVALITLLLPLWLVLRRMEPFLLVRRKWLVDRSGTDLEARIHRDLVYRGVRVGYTTYVLAISVPVLFGEGSWVVKLLACVAMLTWGWAFGRYCARKWVRLARRLMDSPAALAAQVEHDPWSTENGQFRRSGFG